MFGEDGHINLFYIEGNSLIEDLLEETVAQFGAVSFDFERSILRRRAGSRME
jgi:hypothetical protein